METLLAPLRELEEFTQLKLAIENGNTPVHVIGGIDAQKCHFIYGLSKEWDFRLIVTHNEIRAKEIMEDYRMYDRNVMYYPAKDLIFYSADVHGQAIVKERLKVIKKIAENEPVTIVTTIDAGMDYCMPFSAYEENKITLAGGDTVDLEDIRRRLSDMGYENTAQVEREGEFSIRGGILDVFPLTEETPCRIDFWGDEVDTIRSIDVESQRSVENLEKVEIYPASEIFMTEDRALAGLRKIRLDMEACVKDLREQGKNEEAARLRQNVENFQNTFEAYHGMVNLESYIRYFAKEPDGSLNTVSFFDYFKNRRTVVFLDEPNRCIERAEAVEYEFRDSMVTRLEKGYILPEQMDVLYSLPQLLHKLQNYPEVLLSTLDMAMKDVTVRRKFYFQVQSSPSYNNNFSLLAKDIVRLKKQKYRVLLVSASETRGRRLCEDLMDFDIPAFYDGKMEHGLSPGEVMVTRGNVRRGFEYPSLRFVVVTEGDIFGGLKKKKKKKVKQYNGASIHSFNDLKIGDYVVHENHGLGIYQGIEKIEVGQVTKDYLKVAYAAGSNLYVPATSLEVLQKYAGSDAKVPKLSRLNSPEWKKTKTKVRGAVQEIAKELVDLYARRQAKKGHSFAKDTVWQKEFEELFPYEETEDQLKSIEAVKTDMESEKIMDRLICGDVGYGKTEIAIRAAFKAVMDDKQVAFLVPTTILAAQHYNTFTQRMKDFGINVELLCRLRTAAEQKKTIEGLRKGSVDVVVGTHRLLGKDISYKNLGLLVVDEEQRFGVTHKEKLKQMKHDIDVLTLTATPIPRTLHMSLVGIRDMSVLEEPPVDRMPIQTFVMEKNQEIVREAILREVGRGGQVYYVYNRVNNMDIVANEIAKLVPEVVVTFAHGQMNERQLERTMFQFVQGEIDVLVSTTIVETGLDIPNVNTIIIEDADRMGLSQLYQLRGRVGRSNRTAYAFLMYKRDKMLREVAEKRLAAIKEFTELGSGFRISMRDLEIRGAGNLLGAKQHGHMEAVGYDLYCKMLNEAVKRLKGETVEKQEYETSVDIKVDAFIPVSYIKNEFQKLDVYKRIAEIETEEEKSDMLDELLDRFGEPPKSVMNLLRIALLKAKAHKAYITDITDKGKHLRFTMYPQADLEAERIPSLIAGMERRLRFVPGAAPYFLYEPEGNLLEQAEMVTEKISSLCVEKGGKNDEK
ncbi:MAG: transcription-repair coupling factor [Lachnospiraceae bacterium]|nr:transcription-repair coupling factor [Lachnospiraceae bacterium]